MFTYLYGVNHARRNSAQFYLPSLWEGSLLFADSGAKLYPDVDFRTKLVDSGRNRESLEARTELVNEHFSPRGLEVSYHDPDLPGEASSHGSHCFFEKLCVQNSEVFERYSLSEIRSIFAWSTEVTQSDLFQRMAEREDTYSVAHLRRGDIANTSLNAKRETGYSVISKQSYLRAFEKFDVDPDSVLWISDDRTGSWGLPKQATQQAPWSYPEGSQKVPGVFFDWFEDFLLMYFAKTVFRANSSFSWWAACLNPSAEVYSPVLSQKKHFLAPGDEIDVDFVKGNHPHWLNLQRGLPTDEIRIPE